MFLKRIDVIGFKSFADKTVLDFSPGITAVVGPNGSGKSNIADAIRWVLGEQSARSLRGSKMEDVIFAGSETRRSINYCEVSLTLDNEDHHLSVVFDEVTVTRRVYRSGESEYLINKQSCRLKDIHELFMDSGLGRESYSIIGQGRIEEMLSTRPEDRRGPFEDAAGIVKFKHRRREAEKKLDETDQNLVRVDDILSELERQAGPLETEAVRARTFKALADELTILDIQLLVHDIEVLKQRWQQTEQDVGDYTAARLQATLQATEAESTFRTLKSQLDATGRVVEEKQQAFVTAVETRERRDGQVALLQERLQNLQDSLVDKQRQDQQIEGELAELRVAWDETSMNLQESEAEHTRQAGELEVAAHAVNPQLKADLEEKITQLNAQMIEGYHQAATYRNEMKTAEESLVADTRRQVRFDEERARFEQERQTQTDILQSVETEGQSTLDQQQLLKEELAEADQSFHEAAQKEAQVVGDLHRYDAELASLASKLDLLRDLEDGYDGYALGVKTVMQASQKNRLPGIHGTVAQLIQVPRAYEQAIETTLGAALQNVVVDTEATARQAIAMLKQRQAGRATLMPMNVIKSRLLPGADRAKVATIEGFLGLASELISTESAFQPIAEHLLGNVVIADTLIHANELARKLSYRIRIVTLDGDVVSPGGVMSGGSIGRKGPGLLGRSREKSEVEQAFLAAEQQRQQLLETKDALRLDMNEWQNVIQGKTERLRETEGQLSALTAASREAKARRQAADDRLAGLAWEHSQVVSGQSEAKSRLDTAGALLQAVEVSIRELETSLVLYRQEVEQIERLAQFAQERLTTLRVAVATLEQTRAGHVARRLELDTRMKRILHRKMQLGEEMRVTLLNIEQTNRDLEESARLVHTLTAHVAELDEELSLLRSARFEQELGVSQAEKTARTANQELTLADERLHRVQVSLERADIELNHALTKMGETYEMTYEWAKDNYLVVGAPEEVRRQATDMRRKMTAMGDVQLSAMDEWDRLSLRMQFLTTQRDDLLLAKSQLKAVIEEIDEEMSRRFLDAFTQIKVEFQISFRQLFGGGTADLALTSPANPLSSGIEVIAQPPGKRLQNLNLMSGPFLSAF
jgi:chromosome segregation protein